MSDYNLTRIYANGAHESKPIETRIKLTEQEHLRISITLSHIARKIDDEGSIFLGDPELTQRECTALVGELYRLTGFHDRGGRSHDEVHAEIQAWLDEDGE